MGRNSSGIVAGLTAAALGVVGFLAYQASASAPERPAEAQPPAQSVPRVPAGKPAKGQVPQVPANSGTGVRVVYSLSAKQVWLIGGAGKKTRTFAVVPSTVSPEPGSYLVGSRTGRTTGSDGVPIEHVVRFTSVKGVTIGFSARADGSMPEPDTRKKTGGIRMTRADGDAMWTFATINSKIVVVP
ncbi:hypothetical protein LG634_13850 [Streptomyces bambusae]|uniref:hypothetical protein n=1 Tax=Streptomyces bambusae TaxID=1550616 RepID=UPI001CFCE794|nr:hypothetical protein [Streptomyces bambusae]MCB5165915.1 hypothetical protein [Streptomyces bambusae]